MTVGSSGTEASRRVFVYFLNAWVEKLSYYPGRLTWYAKKKKKRFRGVAWVCSYILGLYHFILPVLMFFEAHLLKVARLGGWPQICQQHPTLDVVILRRQTCSLKLENYWDSIERNALYLGISLDFITFRIQNA